MKLPTYLDPALKVLFDPDQKPDEEKYFRQLRGRHATIDRRYISERGFDAQQDFLLRLDQQKRRRKKVNIGEHFASLSEMKAEITLVF